MQLDLLHGVLGIVCVGLGALAAWLFAGRGRAAAEAGAAREARQAAEGEAARVRAELAETDARAGRLEADAAALGERLRAKEAESARQIEHLQQTLTERAESLKREHEVQLQAVQREREQIAKALGEMNERMEKAFGKLAADALSKSGGEFLRLAKEQFEGQQKEAQADIERRREAVERLVKPIGETLAKTDEKLREIEAKRLEQHARLAEQIRGVTEANELLRSETGRLVKALSRPEIRGQYGEIQLRRVAELAGMASYCDFSEQESVRDSDGSLLRPDMVVRLPNSRVIAVDAKTNTFAYLEAIGCEDRDEHERHMERFVKHVCDQVAALGKKSYWSNFEGSPEFVVMFVPGDQFVDAALSRRPDLIETAAQCGVILASPSTLIGLLRAVAVGWREHRLAEEAKELFELGRELHERASVAMDHASKVGDSLKQAVERYNRFVGSVDTRLTPTLRRFEETGVKSAKELPELQEIEVRPRTLEAAPSLPESKATQRNGDSA